MDVTTAAQLLPVLSHLLDDVLEGAGGAAWESLVRLVGGRRRGHPQLTSAMEAVIERPGDGASVNVLASNLEVLARTDPEFAAQLREWYLSAAKGVPTTANANIISGTVHGPAIQAQEIHGGITFGASPPGPAPSSPSPPSPAPGPPPGSASS